VCTSLEKGSEAMAKHIFLIEIFPQFREGYFLPTTSSMENRLPTFQPFPRLPKELLLEIWRFALPSRTIEQQWNNSRFQWEFIGELPAVLQIVHPAALCRIIDDGVRPFYFHPQRNFRRGFLDETSEVDTLAKKSSQ